jgi:hypothetical protein
MALNPVVEDETALHLFYQCFVSENIINNFFRWLTNDIHFTVSRQQLFGEFRNHNNFFNDLMNIASCILLKYIWDCKVRKTLPNLTHLKNLFACELLLFKSVNSQFLSSFNGCGLNLNEILQDNVHF